MLVKCVVSLQVPAQLWRVCGFVMMGDTYVHAVWGPHLCTDIQSAGDSASHSSWQLCSCCYQLAKYMLYSSWHELFMEKGNKKIWKFSACANPLSHFSHANIRTVQKLFQGKALKVNYCIYQVIERSQKHTIIPAAVTVYPHPSPTPPWPRNGCWELLEALNVEQCGEFKKCLAASDKWVLWESALVHILANNPG